MYKPKSLKNILLKYMKGYGNSKKKLFHSWISHTTYMEFCKEFMHIQRFTKYGHFGQFSISQTYCFENGLWKEGRHLK